MLVYLNTISDKRYDYESLDENDNIKKQKDGKVKIKLSDDDIKLFTKLFKKFGIDDITISYDPEVGVSLAMMDFKEAYSDDPLFKDDDNTDI